jgi:hypothetical protein
MRTNLNIDRSRLSLRVGVSLILTLVLGAPFFVAQASHKESLTSSISQARKQRFDPDGAFWILGTPPDEFKDFGGFNLNAGANPRLPKPGVQLTDGTRLRYKSLTVSRSQCTFTTVSVKGVSYSFNGRFLRGGVFLTRDLDPESPIAEGTLTLYRRGKKISSKDLKFTYFGGT